MKEQKIRLWASITVDDEGWDTQIKALVDPKSEPWKVAVADIFRAAMIEVLEETSHLLKDISREELNRGAVQGGSRSVQ